MSEPETPPVYDTERIYTRDELPYVARVHLDHAGEWVAWNQESTRAVATGADFESAYAEAVSAGVESPIMEWVRPLSVRPLGDDA